MRFKSNRRIHLRGRGVVVVVCLTAGMLPTAWWLAGFSGRFENRSPDVRHAPALAATRSTEAAADAFVRPVQYRRKKGGFYVGNSLVPVGELRSGGPPKDGIPALTNPPFIPGPAASFLGPNDPVIGFASQSQARAYPLKILTHHEIVNDRVGRQSIAVTYCPLCDSAAIFDRRTPFGELEFGVSGLLYNSNVLMYDRHNRPESLWSQMMAGGISGPGVGKQLRTLPVELTTWRDWFSRHPETTVILPREDNQREYDRNPYARYFNRPQLMFPVRPLSNRFPLKTPVLGVWTENAARAYVTASFGREPREVTDMLDGKNIKLVFNPRAASLRVAEADDGVNWMYSFWFAWYAFHPRTDVFRGP